MVVFGARWFGFLRSPYERDCYLVARISLESHGHRDPNHQLTIGWLEHVSSWWCRGHGPLRWSHRNPRTARPWPNLKLCTRQPWQPNGMFPFFVVVGRILKALKYLYSLCFRYFSLTLVAVWSNGNGDTWISGYKMKSTRIQLRIQVLQRLWFWREHLFITWSFGPKMRPQIFAKGPDAVKALATNGAQVSSLQGGMQVFSPKWRFSASYGALFVGKKIWIWRSRYIDVSCQLSRILLKYWLDLAKIFVEIVFLLPLAINLLHSLLL